MINNEMEVNLSKFILMTKVIKLSVLFVLFDLFDLFVNVVSGQTFSNNGKAD